MDHKKTKLENRFKSIFFMLIMMLPFCFGTCNAAISEEYITYALEIMQSGEIYVPEASTSSSFNYLNPSTIYNKLIAKLEEDELSDITDYNLTICAPDMITQPVRVTCFLAFIINNNSNSNDLSFLNMGISPSYPNYLQINPDVTVYFLYRNNQYTIEKASNGTNFVSLDFDVPNFGNKNIFTFNDELSVAINNCFINRSPLGSVYIQYPNYGGTAYPMLLVNNARTYNEWAGITEPDEPDEPIESGDTGGGNTGNITNPSGDTTGKVDLSGIEQGIGNINENIDKTNEKLDGISGEIGSLNDSFESFISGEIAIPPGEIEDALNVDVDVPDPTADFFTWFFEQIAACFTVSSNQVLEFEILGNEFAINSDDYIINIVILKNVIGVGSSIFIFYGIFQDIRREIEKIKEGKFSEIANEDISANMM